MQADAEVYRHIGMNDALHLRDLHVVLEVCFGLNESAGSPYWGFSSGSQSVDGAQLIGEWLREPGDALTYQWGLWTIELTVVESYPRDDATPRALCVGGSGEFARRPFVLSDINWQLAGSATIHGVLSHTRPEICELIERGQLHDFLPLLQALGLDNAPELSQQQRRVLRSLPREEDPRGRDALWCATLSLACLATTDPMDEVTGAAMAQLGWLAPDGTPFSGSQVRELCAESMRVLDGLGASGPQAATPMERLEMYRALLQR